MKGPVVFIPGLTDGLKGVSYIRDLASQAMLASIFAASPLRAICYGISSLENDTKELDAVFAHPLLKQAYHRIYLIGHSTGCQNSLHTFGGVHFERIFAG